MKIKKEKLALENRLKKELQDEQSESMALLQKELREKYPDTSLLETSKGLKFSISTLLNWLFSMSTILNPLFPRTASFFDLNSVEPA